MQQPVTESTANPKPSTRVLHGGRSVFLKPWMLLLVVGVVALLMRCWHLEGLSDSIVYRLPMGDGVSYDQWARRIVAGDWLGNEVFYQAPLYPYFLAVVYKLFGTDVVAARFAQAFIGALGCVFLADAGRSFFGRRVGWAAGLLLAMYPTAIFFDGLIQKSVLDLFFVCAMLCLAGRVRRARGRGRTVVLLALGLAMGALILTRENALLLLPVVAVWVIVGIGVQGGGVAMETAKPQAAGSIFRARAIAVVSFFVGVAVVLLPVAIRNKAVGGEFHLTTSQLGPNLYIGNHAGATGTYQSLRTGRGSYEYERTDATELAEKASGKKLSPGEVSSYWVGRVRGFASESTAEWLGLTKRKAVLLLHQIELSDTEDQYTFAAWSPAIRWSTPWFGFGVLVPLAVGGFVLRWRGWRKTWLIPATAVVYGGSVAAFYVVARYRLPLAPMLILLAASAVMLIWRRIRRAKLTKVAAKPRATDSARIFTWACAAAAVTVAGIVTHVNVGFTVPQMMSSTYANIGKELAAHPESEARAPEFFMESIRLVPTNPLSYINLSTCLGKVGNWRLAIENASIAVKQAPNNADAWFALGLALSGSQQIEQAAGAYQRAVTLEPARPEFHTNLGNLYMDAGAFDRALPHLEEAVRLEPANAVRHFNLGSLHGRAGRLPRAIASLQEAVRLNPRYQDALQNLGVAFKKNGQPREAVAAFERYLLNSPNNADVRSMLEECRAAARQP